MRRPWGLCLAIFLATTLTNLPTITHVANTTLFIRYHNAEFITLCHPIPASAALWRDASLGPWNAARLLGMTPRQIAYRIQIMNINMRKI